MLDGTIIVVRVMRIALSSIDKFKNNLKVFNLFSSFAGQVFTTDSLCERITFCL